MPAAQRLLAYVTFGLMAALIIGLYARRYYRLCYSLLPYVGIALLADLLILAWPKVFFTWSFWLGKTTLIALLRLAVALELGALIFQAFPGARATARFALTLGLIALGIGMLLPAGTQPASSGDHLFSLVRAFHPRLSNGATVLFAVIWGLVLYYRTPLHPWHLAILTGLVPYLMVFTLAFTGTEAFGWRAESAGLWDSIAYLLLMAYWNWSLWQTEPPPPADPEVVARLQPWRARLNRP